VIHMNTHISYLKAQLIGTSNVNLFLQEEKYNSDENIFKKIQEKNTQDENTRRRLVSLNNLCNNIRWWKHDGRKEGMGVSFTDPKNANPGKRAKV